MTLSPMQIRFLTFSVAKSIYGFNGLHPSLPCKGAVATTVANSLVKRAYIGHDGRITPLGRRMLSEQTAAVEAALEASNA